MTHVHYVYAKSVNLYIQQVNSKVNGRYDRHSLKPFLFKVVLMGGGGGGGEGGKAIATRVSSSKKPQK